MAEQERGLNNHSLKKIYLTGVVPEQILGKQKLWECWGRTIVAPLDIGCLGDNHNLNTSVHGTTLRGGVVSQWNSSSISTIGEF